MQARPAPLSTIPAFATFGCAVSSAMKSGPLWALRGKPRPTPFAYSEVLRNRFNDAELARCHEPILPLLQRLVDFKRHHYPSFVSQVNMVRGRSDNIYADEWWHIPAEDRRNLIGTGRLAARIGTEFGQRNLDSTVIRFTDEELDCLESMLDVLVNGGGNCMMLGLPEVVKIHRDLHKKFKREKELE
jgi:hypothetical protein